jgi:hypothetical protein
VEGYWIPADPRSTYLSQQAENMPGIDVTNTVTYCFIPIAANVLYGEGQGVLMPKNDMDMLSWAAHNFKNKCNSNQLMILSYINTADSITIPEEEILPFHETISIIHTL